MPIIAPIPIHDVGIATYGNLIGLRKIRYMIGQFETIENPPKAILFTEQVLIGDSKLLDESFSRAETVIITNV